MKFNKYPVIIIKSFFSICMFIIVLFSQNNLHIAHSFSMENYQRDLVTEELRLRIPAEFKEDWLKAEKEVWEPWLSMQDGFLGREIFWDKEKEEALILVKWKNKKLWKNISMKDVEVVQNNFEESVKKSLSLDINPFQLIYEGELYIQG